MVSRIRRLKFVDNASYTLQSGVNGDVEITLNVALTKEAKPLAESAIGLFVDPSGKDFPLLYADARSVLRLKLENKTMFFSNTNAFFGRPEVLTAGNPLADAPSGRGTNNWLESSVETGVYGLSSVSDKISIYGGASYIASGSWGNELFTDRSRTYVHVEDAYFGAMGSNTTSQGGVRQISLTYGRKAFQVDNGMILRLSSANGGERAALQSNPRNAAAQLALVQFLYDNYKLEIFRLDPDELKETDSATVINGINFEGLVAPRARVGAMMLKVPKSTFSYYTDRATYSRSGLRLADVRLSLEPPSSGSGVYARGEFARQTNSNFSMDARAAYIEAGYQFSDVQWNPALSYRYSRFSGDKPDTTKFERWDPLFAGGGGDEWVQGLNEYKVVQTSNVVAHRFMARLRPTQRWELTPQFWVFRADTLNNLGGAQALSILSSKDLGQEINLTARYVSSASLIFVYSAAYTRPGEAIRSSLSNNYKNWLSASALAIMRF